MFRHSKTGYVLSFLLGTIPAGTYSQQVVLESTVGESYVMEIEPGKPFKEVVASINEGLVIAEMKAAEEHGELSTNQPDGFKMHIADNTIVVKPLAKGVQPTRSYKNSPSAQDKADIAYIVNTLANSSLIKIKGAESSLKKAGDRIDAVHPLQFLAYVFTQEELKVSMRNLEGRSWVWKEFLKGLTDTLTYEHSKGQVLPYAQDFANRIGINANVILPSMQAGNWSKFISTLIEVVPRSGNAGRYDM